MSGQKISYLERNLIKIDSMNWSHLQEEKAQFIKQGLKVLKNKDAFKFCGVRFPKVPGVYMIQDKSRRVLYIGEAENLKRRIEQYSHTASCSLRRHIGREFGGYLNKKRKFSEDVEKRIDNYL